MVCFPGYIGINPDNRDFSYIFKMIAFLLE